MLFQLGMMQSHSQIWMAVYNLHLHTCVILFWDIDETTIFGAGQVNFSKQLSSVFH